MNHSSSTSRILSFDNTFKATQNPNKRELETELNEGDAKQNGQGPYR